MMAFGVDARRGEAAVGLVLAICGVGMAVLARQIPLGTVRAPGPGFTPLVMGLALAVLGVGCALRAWRLDRGEGVILGERKPLVCMAALLGCALAWTLFGFVPSSFLMLVVLFRVLAGISWRKALLTAVPAAVLTWLVFERLLGVSLPAGIVLF